MKEITRNEKYVLSLVDPDEVFDIFSKSDGKGLYCRVLKGKYQKTTHELRNLKVVDIKTYIEAAKNNDGYDFVIFYRVAEKTTKDDPKYVRIFNDQTYSVFNVSDLMEAEKICGSGPCGETSCPLAKYRHCWDILRKWHNGDYKEVD